MQSKMKKAALELSTNTLVVVILSMISIALIIFFLNNLTTNTDRLIEDRMQEARKLMEPMSCRDNSKICLSPEVLYLNRRSFFSREPMDTVYLIINNIYGQDRRFSIKTTVIPGGSECVRIFTPYAEDDSFNIIAGGEARIPIIVLRNHEETKCQVRVDVFISELEKLRYDYGIVYVYDRE